MVAEVETGASRVRHKHLAQLSVLRAVVDVAHKLSDSGVVASEIHRAIDGSSVVLVDAGYADAC